MSPSNPRILDVGCGRGKHPGAIGIDLSPGSLRAAARQPTAEEVEEGQERVDQDGELALPADEALEDLDDVVPSADDEAEEEADAQAGPLAEDLADLELEE